MDFFSHALLPYLLAKSFKRKNEEVAAFVLGGIAPDIDVLIMWINFVYPTFFLITHRGTTHSLFFGFLTAVFVLYLASRTGIRSFINRFIKFEPVINGRTAIFACAGAALHIFLDSTTTHGVPLLYPLTTARYSAELFFYTDMFLTILSLLIIIYLYKKPQQRNNVAKFLMVFLIIFALLGSVRILEKNRAAYFFQGENMKTYPTASPFDWYVIGVTAEEIRIYEYNGLDMSSPYNETVKRMDVLRSGNDMDGALSTAEELLQVKMFRWRAYAVAVNASFEEVNWQFEYFDPLQISMLREVPGIFRGAARGFSSMNVTVNGSRAVVT
jgi:inner membrane protein